MTQWMGVLLLLGDATLSSHLNMAQTHLQHVISGQVIPGKCRCILGKLKTAILQLFVLAPFGCYFNADGN